MTLAVAAEGNTLVILRISETPTNPYGNVSFQIQGIQNYRAGYSGEFQIQTLSFRSHLVMEEGSIAGVVFTSIPLETGIVLETPYSSSRPYTATDVPGIVLERPNSSLSSKAYTAAEVPGKSIRYFLLLFSPRTVGFSDSCLGNTLQ
jgi:hypothetical protein